MSNYPDSVSFPAEPSVFELNDMHDASDQLRVMRMLPGQILTLITTSLADIHVYMPQEKLRAFAEATDDSLGDLLGSEWLNLMGIAREDEPMPQMTDLLEEMLKPKEVVATLPIFERSAS